MDGDRYYLATYDPMNNVYASWLYHVANGLQLPTSNIERLGDIAEAGLALLYLATMYPSNFAEIIPNPNLMWRRIETSIRSRETWTCPIKLGKRKRESVGMRITTHEELPDIQRIQAELIYRPAVVDPAHVEPVSSKTEVPVRGLSLQVPEQFGGTCQFCEGGVSALQCNCEVGLLLCTIWKSSVEPVSSFPWERIRRLVDDAEDSANKRQKKDSSAASSMSHTNVSAEGKTLESPSLICGRHFRRWIRRKVVMQGDVPMSGMMNNLPVHRRARSRVQCILC